MPGIGLFLDFHGDVQGFKDALEAHHALGKLHRSVGDGHERPVELRKIRAKGHDGAHGEFAAQHQQTAYPVDGRRAYRPNHTEHDKEPAPDHGRTDTDIPYFGRFVAQATHFLLLAAKQLHQQRAADVQRLVHDRIHLSVVLHGLAAQAAQDAAHTAGRQDEKRQNGQSQDGQPPLQGDHDRQGQDDLEDVGDDGDEGAGDGPLRADHVVVHARH